MNLYLLFYFDPNTPRNQPLVWHYMTNGSIFYVKRCLLSTKLKNPTYRFRITTTILPNPE